MYQRRLIVKVILFFALKIVILRFLVLRQVSYLRKNKIWQILANKHINLSKKNGAVAKTVPVSVS